MDGIELQNMINKYLNEHNKKTVTEVLSEFGKKEEPGVITKHHTIALQQIISEYARQQGVDINEEILKNDGRKQVLGMVSNTEVKYISQFVNSYDSDDKHVKGKVVK